jgi:putative transposase
MDERLQFIGRIMMGERMSDVCREFGISRKTGYKFWNRYQTSSFIGLYDQTRRPYDHPRRTPEEIEGLIIGLRKEKKTWGPKKLKERLEKIHPGLVIPAASTIGSVLERNGMIEKRRRKRRAAYYPTGLRGSERPNDIWCVDFKGQFRLKNGIYCYPLTVSDHFSRFILGCEALEGTELLPVRYVFERLFRDYGLPRVIRSDNGIPFASCGLLGLSRLSVWWMRLGIELERIEPGHPEQNGRHERMHLTLKEETQRPAATRILGQQERFDEFREEYNEIRPHEALEMKTPGEIYNRSARKYPEALEPLRYPTYDYTRKVMHSGNIRLPGKQRGYIGMAFRGESVGLREVKPGVYLTTFMDKDLGYINKNTGKLSRELT